MNQFLLAFLSFVVIFTYARFISATEALPRVEVVKQSLSEQGYFRYKGTSTKIIPRGNNYIKLRYHNSIPYHATFEVGFYNSSDVESALNSMNYYGYNVVRIFIDPGHWSRIGIANKNGVAGLWDSTPQLDVNYMNNVADFIKRATVHKIYVIPVLNELPYNSPYMGTVVPDPKIGGINAFYLNQTYINAKKRYAEDFVVALKARIDAWRMTTIFAYALENELFFDASYPPFSSSSIIVNTADGQSYNMGDASQRQQAADSNMVHWAITLTNAIKMKDHDTMTTVGFFTYNIVGKPGPNGLLMGNPPPPDPRFPGRPLMLRAWAANVDFVDIHVYPYSGWTLSSDMNSIEWWGTPGPIIIGEFGAAENYYSDIVQATYAMRELQVDTCNLYNAAGWLLWTYDNLFPDLSQDPPGHYTVLENNGTINGFLAPIARPNPCVN